MRIPEDPWKPTRLKITDDKGFEKVILIDRVPFAIGRKAQAGLELPEEPGGGVADLHAIIQREGEEFILKDKSGPRGTRVNGRPVRRKTLCHGDRIRLGTSHFDIRFLVEGTRAADQEGRRLKSMLDVLQQLHASPEIRQSAATGVAGIMLLLAPSWVGIWSVKKDELEAVAAGDSSGELPARPTRAAVQVRTTWRSYFQPDHLCVAVQETGVCTAVIDVGPREGKPYMALDLEILESLAAHLGVAFANARLVGSLTGLKGVIAAG